MKKRISLFVCIIMAALCFTGCSGKTSDVEYNIEDMEQTVEVIVSSFASMADEDFAQYEDLSEYQLNYIMMQSGLRIDAEDFLTMIGSWQAGEEECGAYITHGDFKTAVKGDSVVISTEAQYEERNATLNFTFSEDSYLESMDVSASYAMSEVLSKAGLNTLLGMGTVFAVLIFLAFLISLMKYIPVLLNMVSKKETERKGAPVAVQTAPVIPEENVADDLELIAVITAAIAAQEGTTTDGFVVRSIRRRPSNKWR